MVGNGLCDPTCNNRECGWDGYNGTLAAGSPECAWDQIWSGCQGVMSDSPVNYWMEPAQLIMTVGVERLKMEVQAEGTMLITTTTTVQLQWQDKKLHDSECAAALPDVLSLTSSESASAHHRDLLKGAVEEQLYLPRLAIQEDMLRWPDTIRASTFELNRHVPWLPAGTLHSPATDAVHPAGNRTADCEYCAEYQESRRVAIPCDWDWKLFPFDKHEVNLTFVLNGGTGSASSTSSVLHGCSAVVDGLDTSALLPRDNSWLFKSISVIERDHTCQIHIKVQRNSLVFFIKNIIILIIIIMGALLTLRLNPLIPPLVGGRVSGQIFAMNLVASRANIDLKPVLGNVTELLWLDYFYVFHFTVCLFALIETAIVHHQARSGRESLALRIDMVFRMLLPFIFYPVCLLGLLIWAAFDQQAVGLTMVGFGFVLPILHGIYHVRHEQQKFEAKKKKIALALVSCPDEMLNDKQDVPLLREAFKLVDLDKSGGIDSNELRLLLDLMYPNMPREFRKQALHLIVTGTDGHTIKFEDFDETILQWRKFAQENDDQLRWSFSYATRRKSSISNFIGDSIGNVPSIGTNRGPENWLSKLARSMTSNSTTTGNITVNAKCVNVAKDVTAAGSSDV